MARKKPVRKKKTRKKKAGILQELKKLGLGVSLLFIIVAASGYILYSLLPVPDPGFSRTPGKTIAKPLSEPPFTRSPEVKQVHKKSVITKLHTDIPVYEIDKDLAIPVPQQEKPHKTKGPGKPKICIIIDDLGYDFNRAQKFIGLKAPLTYSILPHSINTKKIAEAIHKKGFEIMLHLPMEPDEYPKVNPGEGVLLTSMNPDDLISQLEKNLDDVPYIKGINNHMGSKFTTASTKMYQVFTILKKRNLYFIDSYTTVNSLCMPSARLLQIPYARRDVFIDHEKNEPFIKKQIHLLIRTAEKDGSAIGIGHPYDMTYTVLKRMLPEIRKSADLVSASELVKIL